jgi:hypothetical protein
MEEVEKSFVSSRNIVLEVIIVVTSLALIFGSTIHAMEGKWILSLISLVTIAFMASVFYFTKYTIKGNCLVIDSGFVKSRIYYISDFKRIESSRTLVAAPASGLRRILIETKQGDNLVISPKLQRDFVNVLLKINPTIEIIGL